MTQEIINYEDLNSFLDGILTAIADSQNLILKEQVLSLLENNVDLLNLDLIAVLKEKINDVLKHPQRKEKINLASTVIQLGNLLQDFYKGKRADNLEICLCCYEIAEKIYKHCGEDYLYQLAEIQRKLGSAYGKRIEGDNRKNKEDAIDKLNLTLKVFTKEDFPYEWAETQVELAEIYMKRIEGDKRDNYSEASRILEDTLNIYKEDRYPYKWAVVQDLLGTAYIRGNIYDSRKEDTEKAIKHYQNALIVFSPNKYTSQWAITMTNLGYAHTEGFRNNKKQGIECCKSVLNQINIEDYPYEWAYSSNQLALSYRLEYNNGTRKDENDPENVINIFKSVLDVFKHELYPKECVETHNNIGNSYSDLLKIRQNNTYKELALNAYNKVLEYSRDRYPEIWANVHKDLAHFYQHDRRTSGDRSKRQELAIKHCDRALKVYLKDSYFFYQCGVIYRCLGDIYQRRIEGNKKDNHSKAIEYNKKALPAYEKHNFYSSIFTIKINLTTLYNNPVNTSKEEIEKSREIARQYLLEAKNVGEKIYPDKKSKLANLTRWIKDQNRLAGIYIKFKDLDGAKKIYTDILTEHPIKDELWAQTHRSLANFYLNHLSKKQNILTKEKCIENAISSYQFALKVYKDEKLWDKYAQTLNALGYAYKRRIKRTKENKFQLAIKCYQEALKFHTRENYPYEWAKLHKNLGDIHNNYNYPGAISAYKAALKIYQPQNSPYDCYHVAKKLGDFAFTKKDWSKVIEGYSLAVEATEVIRSFSTNDKRRKEIIENSIEVYRNLIKACVIKGQLQQAIEYVDRSRARQLVDLMASNDWYSQEEIPKEVKELLREYQNIQQEIERKIQRNKQNISELDNFRSSFDNVRSARLEIKEKDPEIDKLLDKRQNFYEKIRSYDLVLASQIQVNPLNWNKIQQLIPNSQTAILSFYTTKNDTYIFILYQDKDPQVYVCQGQGIDELNKKFLRQNWLNPYVEIYKKNNRKKRDKLQKQWIGNIQNVLENISERLKLNDLVDKYLAGIEEAIVIPYLYLHQIPFAALPLSSDSNSEEKPKYLGDRFRIRYIPSCQILQFCQDREPVEKINYGTVEDADGSLPGAKIEGEKIAQLYDIELDKRLIGKSQATVANYRQLLKKVEGIHSSHHATSNLDKPLESYLSLADGNITLQQLMNPDWRLPHLHDVFLSCCETHLASFDITDDILTLGTGFLCAGARSVVSSLWIADDLAATLLSIFYHQQRKDGKSRSHALQIAQQKLRDMSGEELQDIFDRELETDLLSSKNRVEALYEQLDEELESLSKDSPNYKKVKGKQEQLEENYNYIEKLEEYIAELSKNTRPFYNPFYWSVFIGSGLS